MGPELDELLRRGRERGHVTFDEVNAVLTANPSDPEAIDRLLAVLEENCIELIEEGEAENRESRSPAVPPKPMGPRLIRYPRFVHSTEVAAWLRADGIEFGDCVGRFEPDGHLFEVELTVPGERALGTWWRLRKLAPERGLWPYIDGEVRFPDLGSDDAEVRTSDDEFIYERIEPAETREKARQLLEDAARTPADPRTFRAHCRQDWSLVRPSPSFVEIAELLPVPTAEEAWTAAEPQFRGHCNPRDEQPWPWMKVVLVSATYPWEVFAYRPEGGWNNSPYPEVHLTMQRSWYERFGAEFVLASANGATHEYFVPRPPRTRAAADLLAREQGCFGEETIIWGHRGSLEDALDLYRTSHYWYFWWD
jgi:hypothetical protein